jgi:hypothetical protein
MPDNWSFVAAAYGLAAIVFIAYGRWLRRREHELIASSAGRAHSQAVRNDNTSRSRPLSETGHPRPEAGKRSPLQ